METDVAAALAALAVLTSTTFPTVEAATDAYLAFVMRFTGSRSSFISQFTVHAQHILQTRDADGCAIELGGVPIENTFCQYVRASGAPVVITDATRDPRVVNIAASRIPPIGAYLGVPLLLSTGELYGTLCVLDPQPQLFSHTHVELLRIVARHIAALIECEHLGGRDTVIEHEHAALSDNTETPTTVLKMVAHDMRSPLSGIQGYTEMLQEGMYGPVSADQQEPLAQIARAARFINRLANDLLDAAVLDAGRLSVLVTPFDPCQLAHSVLDACRGQAEARGLLLHAGCDTELPIVNGDADRVKQIVLNFMSNALNYTLEGSVTVRVTAGDGVVRFSVEDTGPGIPIEVQQSIWQKHTRLTTAGRGLGLGLYIAQRLAHAMEGVVGVHSAPGQGSVFWVELPLQGPAPRAMLWDEAD